MGENHDLSRMLEEIVEDEKVCTPKKKKLSQSDIQKMVEEKKKARERKSPNA